MTKKIVIGIIITVIISLTSFGAVYAYQNEKLNLDRNNIEGNDISYLDGGNQAGNHYQFSESEELDCPNNEEHNRNNFRFHMQNNEDCAYEEGLGNQYQYMHKNEYNEDCEQECEENKRSFQNQNNNDNKQNRGMNS